MAIHTQAIPNFDYNGVLPPHGANYPKSITSLSPYRATVLEFCQRFATTPYRVSLLKGYLGYRRWITQTAGIVDGVQWVDGSFVENTEIYKMRVPGDIDVLTFHALPRKMTDISEWNTFFEENQNNFDPDWNKSNFFCHAFTINLAVQDAFSLIHQTKYWYGLFSHQRGSRLWKGMIEIPLISNDADAANFLDSKDFT